MAEALTTAFTSVATQCTSAINEIVPIALPVMGAFIVISIGIKAFKRVAR